MRTRLCWTALWCGLAIALTMQFFALRRMSRLEDSIAAIPKHVIWRSGGGIGTGEEERRAVKRFQ